MILCGWIDEIIDGMVHGSTIEGGTFRLPVAGVLDDQRVELEPGRYVSFPNGYMLIDKTIWTTQDMECADREAVRLHAALHFE